MADKIPILRVFDDDGNEYPIPAIQGRKGDRGDGDMNAADYDPQGRKEDIFAALDRHTHSLESLGAAAEKHTHTVDEVSGVAKADHTHTLEALGAAAAKHTHGVAEIEGAAGIVTGSYVGNGADTVTIPFPGGIPEIVFVVGGGKPAMLFPKGGGGYYFTPNISSSVTQVTVSTSGTNVIVSGVNAVNLNSKNTTYRYTGIG